MGPEAETVGCIERISNEVMIIGYIWIYSVLFSG